MHNFEAIQTIKQACRLLSNNQVKEAALHIKEHYPFKPLIKSKRNYSARQMTAIFIRDGFIDRYKGQQLVFPPALRLISHYIPETFPYHKNGKMSVGHIAYWELFPTIDHVFPVTREGMDEESNWVCCSMLTNSIKSNWTLNELGWQLLQPGNNTNWDGMLQWYIDQVEENNAFLSNNYFRTWYHAAKVFNAK
jgi:hypothetical protein